jgi:hypothetical protein
MELHIHHHYHPEPDPEVQRRLDVLIHKDDLLLNSMGKLMLDSSRLLASATAATTKIDSLIALATSQTATMKDLSDQLAAAIAANDPAAIAQVQADMNTAADTFDLEGNKAQAAVDANTPPAPTPPVVP